MKRWAVFRSYSLQLNYGFEWRESCTCLQINGRFTLNENVADNGGTQIAHGAYQKHVKLNGAETVLPELNFTANQLFWISYARFLCSVDRPEFEGLRSQINFHTPNEYRVIGALSNSRRFSHDFGCKLGSTMNPANKCELWWMANFSEELQMQTMLNEHKMTRRKQLTKQIHFVQKLLSL